MLQDPMSREISNSWDPDLDRLEVPTRPHQDSDKFPDLGPLFPKSDLDWIISAAPRAGFRGGSSPRRILKEFFCAFTAICVDFCLILSFSLIHLMVVAFVTGERQLFNGSHLALVGWCGLLACANYYLICWRFFGKSIGLWASSI